MSQITGFVDENRIVGKEIDGDVFELVAGQLRPRQVSFLPASVPGTTVLPSNPGIIPPPPYTVVENQVDDGSGNGITIGDGTYIVNANPNASLRADGTWRVDAPTVIDWNPITRFGGQQMTPEIAGTADGYGELLAALNVNGQSETLKLRIPAFGLSPDGVGKGGQTPNTGPENGDGYYGLVPRYGHPELDAIAPSSGSTKPSTQYLDANGKWRNFGNSFRTALSESLAAGGAFAKGLVPAPPAAPLVGKFLQADGTWAAPPVVPTAPTTHTSSWDIIGKKLTTIVNGVSAITDLSSLDDEGVSMAFSAGTLQLKNAAGTVLSSTLVPDLDAQTLSLTGSTIAISGGNSITLPATPAPVVSNTVAGTGATRTLTTTVSGVTGAAVAIPDTDAQTLSLTGQTLAISGGNSVTLPTSVTVTDNANGTTTVNAGAGQTQNVIRPIDEQTVAGILTAADKFTVLDNGTTTHQSITLADLRKRLQSELATAESVANAPGGVIPATKVLEGVTVPIDTYVDYNGSYASPVTLPVPVHNGQRLVFNHLANLDTTVSMTNSSMTAPLVVTAAMGGAEWIAINGKWHLTTPAPAVATATTHINTWTKSGGLAESVNGVASNIAIAPGTITDLIGYNAAGAPVNAPLVRIPRILEEYKAIGASATHAVIGPNADTQYDTYYISTTIEVTAPGVTYTLPIIPAALTLEKIEVDIKCLGTWTGTVAVAPGAGTIDGAASYSFNKAAATGVNASPSRRFKWANSRWFVV